MKTYLSTLLLALTLLHVGCTPSEIASKQEARYRLAEQKRIGLMSKDVYAIEMQKVSQLQLPEEPAKPFNTASIQREYERESRGSFFVPHTRDYNSGLINQDTYRKRMEAAIYATLADDQQSVTPSYARSSYASGYAGSYDPKSLSNPYGAGSPYKTDGLMNPYSKNGSRYSNNSWTNPYATNAPKLYDANGKYLGRLSTNKYDPDSVSNPYGKYGSKYSSDSINNPYGAGNPYNNSPIYVVPQP
jgi:hypothetical protein